MNTEKETNSVERRLSRSTHLGVEMTRWIIQPEVDNIRSFQEREPLYGLGRGPELSRLKAVCHCWNNEQAEQQKQAPFMNGPTN